MSRMTEQQLAARLQGRTIVKVEGRRGQPSWGVTLTLDDNTTVEFYGFGTESLGIELDGMEVGGA